MNKPRESSVSKAEYQRSYYARSEVKAHRASAEYKKTVAERQRKRAATPEGKLKTRTRKLKREYNLTPEQWEEMFESQGRLCAICNSSEPGCPRGWSTDHCHETQIVRGILCPRCNKALGLFKDSIESLKAAISYLTRR